MRPTVAKKSEEKTYTPKERRHRQKIITQHVDRVRHRPLREGGLHKDFKHLPTHEVAYLIDPKLKPTRAEIDEIMMQFRRLPPDVPGWRDPLSRSSTSAKLKV